MRFNSIITAFAVMVSMTAVSCQKGMKLSTNEMTLHVGESSSIIVTGDTPTGYTSSDTYTATVNGTGLVTGQKVGEADIVIAAPSGAAHLTVRVVPRYTYIVEPIVGLSLVAQNAKYGEPQATLPEYGFVNKDLEQIGIVYIYVAAEGNYLTLLKYYCDMQGNYKYAEALINGLTMADARVFLDERYEETAGGTYTNRDKSVSVSLSADEDVITLLYT